VVIVGRGGGCRRRAPVPARRRRRLRRRARASPRRRRTAGPSGRARSRAYGRVHLATVRRNPCGGVRACGLAPGRARLSARRLRAVRVLLDVSAVPARPVGAGVYTVALATALSARSDVELHLAARSDDEGRWIAIAPDAEVHAVAPRRRPARLVWEQTGAPALAARVRPDVWHGPHY